MEKQKIKILAHVGSWKPGDEIEVPAETAKAMCAVRKRNNGHGLVDYRTAMPLAEFEALQSAPVAAGGLTQGEMNELGLKNVVETPKNAAADVDSQPEGSGEEKSEEAPEAKKSAKGKAKAS